VRLEVVAVLERLGNFRPVLPKAIQPNAVGAVGEPGEPVYDSAFTGDVQGNVIPGFNKDHQHFVFLRLSDVTRARAWLSRLAPRLTTMGQALEFKRAHRTTRQRTGQTEPPLSSVWINVAFSHRGIVALAGEVEAAKFGERSFKDGHAARSGYLGDPPDAARGWPGADVLVIVAADVVADLEAAVADLAPDGLEVVFEQRGDTLPGALRGHEHFGFKDGISQPGVRGKAGGEFITPRFLAAEDPHARLFAKPGQPLLWPGQFLLGEPRQDPQDLYAPAAAARSFPAWARRGSYLVVRRLRQDVEAFWSFMVDHAGETDPIRYAATLVGRWPSGAPLSRAPESDDPALGGDELVNNHFLFEDDTRPSVLRPIPGWGGDRAPQARGDVFGTTCPHFAHIRKVNPRDAGTDMGTPADTLLRLILRRGIPFGPPLIGGDDPGAERGLLFAAYAATIEDQFEFLIRRWVNSELHPRFGGRDPVIGADRPWVTPTGGGYFFAPPVSAVADVLART
jgi:Dyp-type peroxidase family